MHTNEYDVIDAGRFDMQWRVRCKQSGDQVVVVVAAAAAAASPDDDLNSQ
jgi:hypothetical protein